MSRTSVWHGIDGDALAALAKEHGTPFYLYDANGIRGRIDNVRATLEGRVKVYYAVKANPNIALLRALRQTADGLDISSAGELVQALAAGYDASHMSFAGPAKSRDELRAAVQNGVGNISIESPRELHACIDVAEEIDSLANVVVRVNPQMLNRAFGIKMGGRPIQFGVDEESLDEVLPLLTARRDRVCFHGIHVYAGSQCFDANAIAEGMANTFRIAREIEQRSDLVCSTVNLGGGFGVSHHTAEEFDLADAAPRLIEVIESFAAYKDTPREIVFELGRYLTAEAGLYVTRVIGSKFSRGKRFVTVDGGLHHHLSAAGTFGTALRKNFLLENLTRPNAEPVRCSIAGPSCNPTDLLGINIELPAAREGDLIGVLRSGSYGLTASPTLFLGRPSAAELILDGDEVRLGRRSLSILDFN